jgi:hypothetical protein
MSLRRQTTASAVGSDTFDSELLEAIVSDLPQ